MEIQLFNSPQFGDVRMSADENGEPLFCATDVARALGYAKPQDAIVTHCKPAGVAIRGVGVETGIKADGTPATQVVQMKFITEGNLYRLIARSKLPEAEKFESWIFDEVVPTIRKTGGVYATNSFVEKAIASPDYAIKILTALKEERERTKALSQENAQKQALIEAQKPKVLFADAVATAKQSCLVGELAKILKQNGVEIGQNRMFTWLRDNEYLGKIGQYYNIPTQKSMDLGLFEIKKNTVVKPDGSVLVTTTTKVTGKGQQYFINKFLGERPSKPVDTEPIELIMPETF